MLSRELALSAEETSSRIEGFSAITLTIISSPMSISRPYVTSDRLMFKLMSGIDSIVPPEKRFGYEESEVMFKYLKPSICDGIMDIHSDCLKEEGEGGAT